MAGPYQALVAGFTPRGTQGVSCAIWRYQPESRVSSPDENDPRRVTPAIEFDGKLAQPGETAGVTAPLHAGAASADAGQQVEVALQGDEGVAGRQKLLPARIEYPGLQDECSVAILGEIHGEEGVGPLEGAPADFVGDGRRLGHVYFEHGGSGPEYGHPLHGGQGDHFRDGATGRRNGISADDFVPHVEVGFPGAIGGRGHALPARGVIAAAIAGEGDDAVFEGVPEEVIIVVPLGAGELEPAQLETLSGKQGQQPFGLVETPFAPGCMVVGHGAAKVAQGIGGDFAGNTERTVPFTQLGHSGQRHPGVESVGRGTQVGRQGRKIVRPHSIVRIGAVIYRGHVGGQCRQRWIFIKRLPCT